MARAEAEPGLSGWQRCPASGVGEEWGECHPRRHHRDWRCKAPGLLQGWGSRLAGISQATGSSLHRRVQVDEMGSDPSSEGPWAAGDGALTGGASLRPPWRWCQGPRAPPSLYKAGGSQGPGLAAGVQEEASPGPAMWVSASSTARPLGAPWDKAVSLARELAVPGRSGTRPPSLHQTRGANGRPPAPHRYGTEPGFPSPTGRALPVGSFPPLDLPSTGSALSGLGTTGPEPGWVTGRDEGVDLLPLPHMPGCHRTQDQRTSTGPVLVLPGHKDALRPWGH